MKQYNFLYLLFLHKENKYVYIGYFSAQYKYIQNNFNILKCFLHFFSSFLFWL